MATTARVLPYLAGGDVTAVVDSIGVGGGVVDRLRELRQPVLPYTGSAGTRALDRTRQYGFVSTRAAAWWHLRELLDPAFDAAVMLPPDDLLLSDLNAPTWDVTTGVPPKIRLEKKEDVAARLGRSPDRGDAVVMSFWADALRREMRAVAPAGVMPTTSVSPFGGSEGVSGLGPLG